MKRSAKYLQVLFLLVPSVSLLSQTPKKNGLELDLSALAGIHMPSQETFMVKAPGYYFTIDATHNTSASAALNINYRIGLNSHLSLVPGISYFLFTQSADIVVTDFYERSYGRVSFTNHGITAGLGLRWTGKAISIENGLALLDILKRAGQLYGIVGNAKSVKINGGDNQPYLFLQSYHKIGYNLNKHIGIYAGLYMLYANKASESRQGHLPIAGVQLMPGLSFKFLL